MLVQESCEHLHPLGTPYVVAGPCLAGEGAWRSHCSAASCPLPLASLIHLSRHNNTDTQQMSPVLPGWFGNATGHTTATIDQCAPSWVTSDGNQPSLRSHSSRHGSAQSLKGATCCCGSGWTGSHQDPHLAFSKASLCFLLSASLQPIRSCLYFCCWHESVWCLHPSPLPISSAQRALL